jgi:hypothetical protein
MDVRTRRESLRVVAKLVFGAASTLALTQCGGKTATPRESSGNDVQFAPAPVADAACTFPGAVRLYSPPEAPAFTRAEVDCCMGHLAPRVATGGSQVRDATFANCCNAIIAASDSGMIQFADVESGVRQACCFSGTSDEQQAMWVHSLCAPWGPPVPPAMDSTVEGIA